MIRRAGWLTPLFPSFAQSACRRAREWWKQTMWRPAPLPTTSHSTPTLRLRCADPMPSLAHMAALVSAADQIGIAR